MQVFEESSYSCFELVKGTLNFVQNLNNTAFVQPILACMENRKGANHVINTIAIGFTWSASNSLSTGTF